jgi:hypothetical protein
MLNVGHLEVFFCYCTVLVLVFLSRFVSLNVLVSFVLTDLRTRLCPRSSELDRVSHMTFKLIVSAHLECATLLWFQDERTLGVWARKTTRYRFWTVAA